MNKSLLLGLNRFMLPIPPHIWRRDVEAGARQGPSRISFMTADHRRIRDFVVRELPRIGEPISPDRIAQDLGLPLEHVVAILDDLEKHMTFLYRNEQGEVVWAYPVTVAPTPHRVTFSTGEQVYAA